jgi:hypothetical protein
MESSPSDFRLTPTEGLTATEIHEHDRQTDTETDRRTDRQTD